LNFGENELTKTETAVVITIRISFFKIFLV